MRKYLFATAAAAISVAALSLYSWVGKTRPKLFITCVKTGNLERMKQLVRCTGANNLDFNKAIVIASNNDSEEMVKFLLEYNELITVEYLNAAASAAVSNNCKTPIPLLYEAGATNATSLIKIACRDGHSELIEPLVEAGANPSAGLAFSKSHTITKKLMEYKSYHAPLTSSE